MKYIELFQRELVSFGLVLVSAFILWVFRARAKLMWGLSHGFAFQIRPQAPPPTANDEQVPAPAPFLVHSRSLLLVNQGRLPATNAEVVFNWRPENFEVWPARPFETASNPDGRFTVRFSSVAPEERIQIELLNAHDTPAVMNVRCSECVGVQIPIAPARQFQRWIIALVWTLIFFGTVAVVYIFLTIGALFLH